MGLPELRTEASPEKEEKEEGGKTEESSQGITVKASGTTGKAAKKGQKKGKGKPAAPRQYNLGDYL